MDITKLWQETLLLLEKTLTDVVYNSMIMKLSPIKLENNTLYLSVESSFFKTAINSRYLYDITRCVRSLTDIDIEVQIESPNDKTTEETIKFAENYAKTNLRPKYTFDTFVKGKSNEMAYAAALSIAEQPGESSYNPLFLYGGVGLGKTHLVQSIGNFALEQNPNLSVVYQSTESFTNELIYSIRDKTTQNFKNKYRRCDLLLLDDIQFLERTVETQEEIFHTFNTLYNENKQIVLTSDLPPKELGNIEKRLTTRFGMGLIVDVTLPDYETRAAILEKKLHLERLALPPAVKEFIIRNIVSNIRDLEGALNKVIAYARFTNTPITLELTREALKDQLEGAEKPIITVEYIQQIVADYHKITVEDLNSRRRTKDIVIPRQIAMYLARKIMKNVTLPQIGAAFGKRDHTTVMHGCEKISGELEYDAKLQDTILDLERKIVGEE
ncbi:MAG: chromosomal replication initiator protein DnaA [Defluviitaleaceae bacterium]|nr:chromosomal replication initiator protein DnaA [Defluviitaleaceae bacterium]